VRTADMRYVGQGHEISVPMPLGEFTESSDDALQAAFDASYKKLYGRLCEGVPVEAIHWRVTVSGPEPEICDSASVGDVGSQGAEGQRDVLFSEGKYGTAVYRRDKLGRGAVLKGPAIVEEVESTTVLPPGWVLQVDDTGNLILIREDV
ncbi:MAG: hypothetical protein OXR71_11305, partial [Gemmatimonadota bacterium]|nr:hypothetical protein [Gemmatimonadota bacterium]